MDQVKHNLTRAQIRRAIRSVRKAQSDLARQLGVSGTAVSLVLRGTSKSEKIMAAAAALAEEIIKKQQEEAA